MKWSGVEINATALARRPMRFCRLFVVIVVFEIAAIEPGFAQTGAKLKEIDGFISKGVFSQLDPGLMKHRLTLGEIKEAGLNGQLTDIDAILTWMAKCEKMGARVEEPLEVRGRMAVSLPPNTMGDEAFTACFYAFTFNGLGFAGVAENMELVRPEKHPRVERIGGPWNPDQILSTRLFRLGYLKPDPIMRHYSDKLGSPRGLAVVEHRSNVLIVTDAQKPLDSLGVYIDSEILEAMGVPASDGHPPGEGPRPPSLGAIASRESIHFYLMAFARSNQIPLAGAREKDVTARYYPEADLWTDEQGFKAVATEYQRISEYVELLRQAGGQGWEEPNPQRTLSPGEQKRMAIRFGLAGPAQANRATPKNKKTARKR
jgi:hypothetical protein